MSKTFMKDLARLCILKNIIFLFSGIFFKFFFSNIFTLLSLMIFLLYDKSLTFIFYVQSNLYIDCKLLERIRSDWYYWMIFHFYWEKKDRDMKRFKESSGNIFFADLRLKLSKIQKNHFSCFSDIERINDLKYIFDIWYLSSFL